MDFVWYLRPRQGLRFDLRSNRGVISERHEDAATQRRRRVDRDGRGSSERGGGKGEEERGVRGKVVGVAITLVVSRDLTVVSPLLWSRDHALARVDSSSCLEYTNT